MIELADFRAGGITFDPERDGARINRQRMAVWRAMSDGQWHTLRELSKTTGHPEASISARLRDFRKVRYGAHTVLRQYVFNGLWEYRVIQAGP